jgi:TetR/AcrR family transcriptional regulator, transcriptional repressor for nem operon
VLETALTIADGARQKQGVIDSQKSPRALARFIVATIQGLRVVARGNADAQQVRRLHDVVEVAVGALSRAAPQRVT